MRLIRIIGQMTGRCASVTFIMCSLCVGALYLLLFHKPPTDDIIEVNKHRTGQRKVREVDLIHKDVKLMSPAEYSAARWEAWAVVNDLASIGDVYDKCEGDDRISVGRILLVKDPKTGGLIHRTYCNISVDIDITTGDLGLEVWYNTRELYKNHWELCTVEDDMPETEKMIFCPVKRGNNVFKKDILISRFLPKGRYQTKSWVYDQNNKMVACAYCDFTL